MCEEAACPHASEEFCNCAPVRHKEQDILGLVEHIACSLVNAWWELEYTDLYRPEKRRLCRIGTCRICSGRLCHELALSDLLTGEDLLAAIYRCLQGFRAAQDRYMPIAAFRQMFAEIFREADQPLVREWLEKQKSGCASREYPQRKPLPVENAGESVRIFTIIRTGADTDRCCFPPPQSEGSYLSLPHALRELQRLIEVEKERLDKRYDSEESGEDYWEAYQEGYADALFTRLEVVSSDQVIPPKSYLPEAFQTLKDLEQQNGRSPVRWAEREGGCR